MDCSLAPTCSTRTRVKSKFGSVGETRQSFPLKQLPHNRVRKFLRKVQYFMTAISLKKLEEEISF